MIRLVATLASLMMMSFAARAQTRIVTIGTGNASGVYQVAGDAVCRLVNQDTARHGLQCRTQGTAGSVQNVNALKNGEIDFAIVQSDVQYHAVKGLGRFKEGGPHKELRAVFSVYPEPLMVVAGPRTGVEKFEDFKGKRFNLGNPGSGTRPTIDMLMSALRMKPDDFAKATELSPDEHGKALCEGRIDGFGFVVGNPSANLVYATKACHAHVIPLHGPAIDRLVIDHPYFAYTTLAEGSYPGMKEPVRTFGVVATFVTSSRVADDVVQTVVAAVFDHFESFRKQHPSFSYIHPMDTLNSGLTAPLHDGAFLYFRAKGLIRRGN